MRGLGRGLAVAIGVAVAIVASASCSYGTYDGSAADASTNTLDIAFTPGAGVTRLTADRFLFVQIPPDAFATATTVHVTRLADRLTSLTYPVFQITADAPLTGRIAIEFNGANNNNGNPNLEQFAVGRLDGGNYVPLAIGGMQQNVVWGVAAALGTFTVDRVPLRGYDRQGSHFQPSCFDKCCGYANVGTGANQTLTAGASKNGCYCYGDQGGGGPEAAIDLQCFLGCADTKGEAERCVGRGFIEGTVECGSANAQPGGCSSASIGGPLNGVPPCCRQPQGMGGSGDVCGLSGCNNPTGPIRRCGGKANCATGECCLFTDDNEYRCATTCPGAKL